tara:strand:+ start:715 stop:1104 length:390 start_codon:yes stop_codon:yes gene_type:complete
MPKEETKAQLTGIISEFYYNINNDILYNEWIESPYSDGAIDEIEKQGKEVCKENMKLAFYEAFYNKATTGHKLRLCFSAHITATKELVELRKQFNNIIKLVKGADTEEKINMLKELSLLHETCLCNNSD